MPLIFEQIGHALDLLRAALLNQSTAIDKDEIYGELICDLRELKEFTSSPSDDRENLRADRQAIEHDLLIALNECKYSLNIQNRHHP